MDLVLQIDSVLVASDESPSEMVVSKERPLIQLDRLSGVPYYTFCGQLKENTKGERAMTETKKSLRDRL